MRRGCGLVGGPHFHRAGAARGIGIGHELGRGEPLVVPAVGREHEATTRIDRDRHVVRIDEVVGRGVRSRRHTADEVGE